jgi:hypothetical protein
MIGHVAGIPVEETLLAFVPLGAAGLVAIRVSVLGLLRRPPR